MSGALALAGEVAALLAVAWAVRGAAAIKRVRWSVAGATAVSLIVVTTALGVYGLATSGHSAVSNYRSYSGLSADQRLALGAAAITARLEHVPIAVAALPRRPVPTWLRFTEWLRSRIPSGAEFQIVSPPALRSSLFDYWVDWRLLPRVEVVAPHPTRWVVYFESTPPRSVKDVIAFAPGFVLARSDGRA
jgi:hypothetical protein